MSTSVSSQSPCQKRVGFLFPRICGRTSSLNCPHCHSDTTIEDPFFLQPEHNLYPNYGQYEVASWVANLDNIDFTESDAVSLQNTDLDFEMDMGAS